MVLSFPHRRAVQLTYGHKLARVIMTDTDRDNPWTEAKLALSRATIARLGFAPAVMRRLRATKLPLHVLWDPVLVEYRKTGAYPVALGLELRCDEPTAPMTRLAAAIPAGYQLFGRLRDTDPPGLGICLMRTTERFAPVQRLLTFAGTGPGRGRHPVVAWLKRWDLRCRWHVIAVGDGLLRASLGERSRAARESQVLDAMIADAASICSTLRDSPQEFAAFARSVREEGVLHLTWDAERTARQMFAGG